MSSKNNSRGKLPKNKNLESPVQKARVVKPIRNSSPPLKGFSKDINIELNSSIEEDCNVTIRNNTNASSQPTANLVLEDKLREIIKQELNTFLETKVKYLISDQLMQMSQQIAGFKESMDFYNSQFETYKLRLTEKDDLIKKLQAENEHLLASNIDHGTRLALVEQSLRENNLEINGIPEYKTENVITTVLQLAKTVGEPLEDSDILQATRVAKLNPENNRPRPVVVKLRTPRHRDNILAAVVRFNKTHSNDKLNSQHLGISGDRKPVYVAEHLCLANKQLHAATRKLAKELNYKFVWVRNGRVFVRKDESHSALLIRSMDSLSLLKNDKKQY